MKSIKFIIFSIFIILQSPLYSQKTNIPEVYPYFSPQWDFYSENNLSAVSEGKGYTGIADECDISGIYLNPASLNIQNKYSVYFEYLFKSSTQFTPNLENAQLEDLHPSFLAGFGYNLSEGIKTGLVISTNNRVIIDLGTALIATSQNPDGIGSYDDKVNIGRDALTVPIVFKIGIFRFGANLSLNYYHSSTSEPIIDTINNTFKLEDEKVNFIKFNTQFGLIINPIKNLSLGITYSPENSQSISVKYSDGQELVYQTNKFPSRLGIGVKYRFSTVPFSLLFDYNSSNTSNTASLIDRRDFNAGFEYDLPEDNGKSLATIRGGVFSKYDYRNSASVSLSGASYDQLFITAGLSIKTTFGVLNFAIMDSHLLMDNLIKTSYFDIGYRYDF